MSIFWIKIWGQRVRDFYRSVFHSTKSLYASTFANSVLNFISGIVMAHVLGPASRGIVQEFKILTSVIPSALHLNLGSYISSQGIKKDFNFKGILLHLAITWLIFGFYVYAAFDNKITTLNIFLIIAAYPLYFSSTFLVGLAVKQARNNILALMSFITVGGSSIGITVLYFFDTLKTNTAIYTFLFFSLVSFALVIRHVNMPIGSRSIYVDFLKFMPIHFSVFVGVLIGYLDQIYLMLLVGSKVLGIYVVALSFASISNFITSPILLVVPQIASTNQKAVTQKRGLQLISFVYLTLFAVFVALIAPLVIKFQDRFLDDSYDEISKMLLPICAGVLLSSYNDMLRAYLAFLNIGRILIYERIVHIFSITVFFIFIFYAENYLLIAFYLLVTQFLSFIYLKFNLGPHLKNTI